MTFWHHENQRKEKNLIVSKVEVEPENGGDSLA
jgi:hypothetical protein